MSASPFMLVEDVAVRYATSRRWVWSEPGSS